MTQHYGLSVREAMLLGFGIAIDWLRILKNAAAEREARKCHGKSRHA